MPLDYEDRAGVEATERGLVDRLDPCVAGRLIVH
jgi:hypothetical protein